MENRRYQICSLTVMDTSDSRITFDEHSVCDHASDFLENTLPIWKSNLAKSELLLSIIRSIKDL